MLLHSFMFLLVVSRIYDPNAGVRCRIWQPSLPPMYRAADLDEILSHEVQERQHGRWTNKGYDIDIFSMSDFPMILEKLVLKDVSFAAKQGRSDSADRTIRRRQDDRIPAGIPILGCRTEERSR